MYLLDVASGDVTVGNIYEGKETLDGVPVQHWTMPSTRADQCFSSLELGETGELTAAGGDLYVAIDAKYVVKMALFLEGAGLPQLTGSDAQLDAGRMDVTFAMSDVNRPITIQVPQAALAARTRAAAKATDEYVHAHPWKAIGVGAGVGLVIGLLIGRR